MNESEMTLPSIRLEVIEGPCCGATFVLQGHESFVVGRSSRAHFRLPKQDPYFSRVHFLIEVNPPQCRLVDMLSKNGTCVNGQRVEAADLGDGDLIRAGTTAMRVVRIGPWPEVAPTAFCNANTEAERADSPELAETGFFVRSSKVAGHVNAPAGTAGGISPTPTLLRVPGFLILEELGRGGMGVVYLAERAENRQRVAIKSIRPAVMPSAKEVHLFLRETRILQQLRHPHIVSFHESGESEGLPYFVMDYIDGVSAAAFLKQKGRFPIRLGVRLICEALDALQFAHEQGFVHRDVKPDNLLIHRDGMCYLSDFGLARAYQLSSMSGLTMLGDAGGTVPYMPPEQITHYRDAKPAVDQYAAAATLYRLLTGEYVFDFAGLSSQQRLGKILCDPPVPIRQRRPEIPPPLAAVIHKALDKDASRRFAHVGAMRAAMEEAASGLPKVADNSG